MRDECILCDASVIRPEGDPPDKPLLCATCKATVQEKVNAAVRRVEQNMMQPKPQPWYVPDPYNVVAFVVGVALGTLAHFMGWFR